MNTFHRECLSNGLWSDEISRLECAPEAEVTREEGRLIFPQDDQQNVLSNDENQYLDDFSNLELPLESKSHRLSVVNVTLLFPIFVCFTMLTKELGAK